ncbi:MAG: M36 family metallopeptidase [Phycisphaerales bacterium]|nr:M36 family metallopeptidase [Phycisphaerales bacterium]
MRSAKLGMVVTAAALFGACGLAMGQHAHSESCEHSAMDFGLPQFDVREQADGSVSKGVAASMAAYRGSTQWQKRQASADALRAMVPSVKIDTDPRYGSPQFVRSVWQFMTGPTKDTPRDVARGFVNHYSDLFGISSADLDRSRVSRDFETSEGLMHHLTFQQMIDGIDVYGCTLIANVTGRGELITIGSKMVPNPASVDPYQLDAHQALRAAAAACGVAITTMPEPGEASGANEHRKWVNSADFANGYEIETKKVYFAKSRGEVVPAWWVIVPVKGPGNQYETIVDARTGELLFRHNLTVWETTQPATYRVYPLDSPAPWSPGPATPDGAQAPFVERQLITVQPQEIAPYSPNGWINDGDNRTVGNNVDAYSDAANDNTASDADRAVGTAAPGRVFDFVHDVNQAPGGFKDAAVTNLFVACNSYHDRLFAMGFNEAAGNYQTLNLSGQGVGGDAVRAEAMDGSGTNNANWSSTGADGSAARTQMYIFTGPSPQRNGTLDNDVVYHELSHGVSIRLHNGLSGNQSRSMGEGWGDFYGTCLNAEPTDDFNGVYTTGGWVTKQFLSATYLTNYYYGIRRFPYSTDMLKNPYTFADIDPNQYAIGNVGTPPNPVIGSTSGSANEVHNAGEVWCNALLEARASMGIDEGYAANQIIMQLAVDGMKLAPDGTPDFLDERDGILLADLTRYGGSHQFRLWQAFAKRGMGENALSPDSSTNGIVESFDLPVRVDFSFPDGTPEQFGADGPTSFRVLAEPFNLTINPGPGTLFYSIDGGAFNSLPLPQVASGEYLASIPASPCFSTVRFYLALSTNVGQQTGPRNAPVGYFQGLTFSGTTEFANQTFETDPGWTVQNTAVPSTLTVLGGWTRMDPEPTFNGAQLFQPGDDHTPDPGSMCWVTDGRAGTTVGQWDVDNGYTVLTTPTIDLSSAPLVVVEYWRWFASFSAGATGHLDPFTVEVSNNNGATWQVADSVAVGSPVVYDWVRSQFTMSAATIPTSAQVKFRFRAEDTGTAQNFVEAAIDDFKIFRYECSTGPSCDPDYNQDGNVDQDDVRYLVGVIAGGPNPTGRDADFNQDGNVDQDDYAALVNVVAGGDCP